MKYLLTLLRIVVACLLMAEGARAQDPSAICESAAQTASQQSGVPYSVLMAISLNETGRKRGGEMRPWPWTVNMEGAGHWFDTLEEARAYAHQEYARGARSFDLGCFQINYKWHHEAFSSLDEMFHPVANALYAAKFLSELYAETGDWSKAAGAYHSRTPQFADKYAARFDRFRANMAGTDMASFSGDFAASTGGYGSGGYGGEIPEIPDIVAMMNGDVAPQPERVRVNNYQLLQAGTGTMGSLVPTSRVAAVPSLLPEALVE